MKRWIAISLFALFAMGCSSSRKNTHYIPKDDSERVALLDEALGDLSNESYTGASIKLEHLLAKDPASELDLVILYNSGVALEGMGNCSLAQERYRSTARIAATRFDKVAALALYRLGFTYDCLGKPRKAVVAFLDARKKAKLLPPEVASAELPARLAAAYASLGRQKEALYFFNQASNGLKRLLSKSKTKEADRILAANTMYSMGRLSETNDPILFARMLNIQQPFLLQAVELQAGKSSQKANEELRGAYKRIETERLPTKQQEREFYIEALRAARQLKKIRLPSAKQSTADLFQIVDATETTLQKRLIKLSETLPKTPQEQKRNSLKKEGKLIEPKSGK